MRQLCDLSRMHTETEIIISVLLPFDKVQSMSVPGSRSAERAAG